MPKRKRSRSTRGRRRKRSRRTFRRVRRGAGRSGRARVSRQGFLIADRTVVKLRFRTRYPLTSSSGVISTLQQFRGNSPFDPDFTGVGVSAAGFTTYSSIYNSYRCYGSSIMVQWCNTGTSAGTQVMQVGVSATPASAVSYTTIDQLLENPYGKVKILSFNANVPRTKMYMSTAKIEGVHKKTVVSDDAYGSAVTTNPSNPWFWNIMAQSVDQTTTSVTVAYVTITYYCEFYGRIIF